MKEDKSYPSPTEEEKLIKERKKKKIIWTSITAGIVAIVTMILLLIFLIPRETKYEIELNSNITGVVLNGQGEYKDGEEVTIIAEDIEGYRFIGWEYKEEIVSEEKEYTFKLTEDKIGTYTAKYQIIEYTVTLELSDGEIEGESEFNYTIESEDITLARPTKEGYEFIGWTWEEQTEPQLTVIITKGSVGNRTYTANYEIKSYNINKNETQNGSFTVNGVANYNEIVTLEITPNSGCEISEVYYIKNGSGERHNINNVDGQYSFIMPNSDITIYVVFSKINYQLATEINNGEILGLSSTAQTGDNVTFTVETDGLVEDKYYGVERVYYTMEDGQEYDITSDNNVYTFTMPSGNITLHVDVFEKKTYLDYVFDDDSIVLYVGDETEIIIPSSYSKVEVPFKQVNSQTFSNYQEFTNSTLYQIEILKSGYFYLVEDEENILITDFYEFENKMSIDDGPFTIKYENYQFTAEEMNNALQVALLLNIFKGYSFKLVTNDNEIIQIDNITIDNWEEKLNETKELLIQKNSFPVQVQFSDTVSLSIEGDEIYFKSINGFDENQNIEKIIFLEDSQIINIGDWAFSRCYNLTSIELPNSVTSIGYQAFQGCTSLTSITLGDNVTSIGSYAFSYFNNNISEVYYKGTIDEWISIDFGEPSTAGTSNPLSNGAKLYLKENEDYKLVTEVTINQNIKQCAFYGCTSLTSITLGENVTSIGNDAFSGCTSLASITLGDNVTSIGDYAFSDCTSLTSITLGENVTSIGSHAFWRCTSLTSITLGENLTSIGSDAFRGCTSLTSITIPNSVTSIGSQAFQGCTSLTSITLGENVTSIAGGAFSNCTSLTSVTIPNSVTSIGDGAFSGCTSLASITIGENVTSIGDNAFNNCTSLTSVTIPNSVTSIGYDAFYSCTNLANVTLGENVTSIGYQAFYNCTNLASITIPNSVTSIGNSAFSGCRSLTSVTIESEYVYNNADGVNYDDCGYILQYAQAVKVLKTIVDKEGNTNSYLNDTSNFTKTEEGDYYIYTKVN